MTADRFDLLSAAWETLPVLRVIEHSPTLKSFRFERPFSAEPGQFVLLWLPGIDEKPFAISALTDDELEITIKAVGPFTRAMMGVRPGLRLGVRGPFGRGFRDVGDGALLIGGGVGNAPLRLLADRLRAAGHTFRWLLGGRTATDLPWVRELAGWPQVQFATEDGSLGIRGRVTTLLPGPRDPLACDPICAAGPEAMLHALYEWGRARVLIRPGAGNAPTSAGSPRAAGGGGGSGPAPVSAPGRSGTAPRHHPASALRSPTAGPSAAMAGSRTAESGRAGSGSPTASAADGATGRQRGDDDRPRLRFAFERYMKCGIGLCGQCCVDGSGDRVCVEGPVFDEEQLAGITDFGLPPRGPSGRRKTGHHSI